MSGPLKRPRIPNPLLRQELPWLVAEVVLLVILFNANPPELWFWLVVLLVVLLYRVERWWSSGRGPDGVSPESPATVPRCSPRCG
jgi:hypothetical protein